MKCPYCEIELEELTEITGYHYWMCGNSECEISYKFSRKAAQQSEQADGAYDIIKKKYQCPVCDFVGDLSFPVAHN